MTEIPAMRKWSDSLASLFVLGSRYPDPNPRKLTLAPDSLWMYSRFTLFSPVSFWISLKLLGEFTKVTPTGNFSSGKGAGGLFGRGA